MSPGLQVALEHFLVAFLGFLAIILPVLAGVIVKHLRNVERKLDEGKERGEKIIAGQQDIRDRVSNGAANKIGQRVLDAENSYTALKGHDIVTTVLGTGIEKRDSIGEAGTITKARNANTRTGDSVENDTIRSGVGGS